MKIMPPNPDVPLKGWLKKRHSHKSLIGKQWGKRYVVINAKRGERADASMVLPLCDVTEVRTLEENLQWNEWHDFCFEICAPPQKVQLRADTLHDAQQWVATIREQVDDWKSAQRLKLKARMSGAPAIIASQYSAEMIRQQNLINVYDEGNLSE